MTDELTPAERIDPDEHIDPDDPRYDGFRIREYWMATAIGPDNQEGPLYVNLEQARHFHLSPGPAMASDSRRLVHLYLFAQHIATANNAEITIRHFIPEGDPEVIK